MAFLLRLWALRAVSVFQLGPQELESIRTDYIDQARALQRGGVDLLHIELCQDLANTTAALEAVALLTAEFDRKIPVMVTASLEAIGPMLDGTSPEQFLAIVRQFRPSIVGFSSFNPESLAASVPLSNEQPFRSAVFLHVF